MPDRAAIAVKLIRPPEQMALRLFLIAVAAQYLLGLLFYPASHWTGRARTTAFLALIGGILLAPILIPSHARFLRLLAAVNAVAIGARMYDEHAAVRARRQPISFWTYVTGLGNPFAVALRRVMAEPARNTLLDLRRAAVGLILGSLAILLLIRIFEIDWRNLFVAEHCAKAIALFLIIQFLPNGLAASARLVKLPATDFGGLFFLARTPAEFWRLYNRPAEQFFYEHVFKPAGGRHRMILATLATFAVSGVIHEYVFDLAARRVLGTQMAFFMLEGLAVVATLRLRPRGWMTWPAILLTFAFNVAAVRIFLASLNAIVPFYVSRH